MSWSEYFDVIGWFVKSRRAWIHKEYKGREEEKNSYLNLKTKEIFYTYYFSNVICNVHHSDNHGKKIFGYHGVLCSWLSNDYIFDVMNIVSGLWSQVGGFVRARLGRGTHD